jgi:hypothetical protein
VFDYVADPERHHDWNLSLLRTEMVDVGPVGVGTRVSYEFRVHGLLGPVMIRPLRRGMRENLDNLRQVLEAR